MIVKQRSNWASRRARTDSRERLLKARDVAQLLGLEVATVVDHAQAGDLPGFRLYGRKGGPLRFKRSEIERVLETWRFGADTPSDNSKAPAARERSGADTGGVSDATRTLRPVGERE